MANQLNSASTDNHRFAEQGSDPASPAASFWRFYFKATGAFIKSTAGVVSALATLTGTETFTNKTLTTPTIGSMANAQHNHSNAAGGGQITDAALSAAVGIAKGGTGQTTQTAAMDALSPTTTKGDIIAHNGSDNVRLAVGATNGHVLTVDSSTATGLKYAAPGGGVSYAILRDEKATTTQGGSAAAATWNARNLNTEVTDADNIVTVASNQFTPIAGDYLIDAYAPARQTNGHRLRLYNVTGAASVDEGQNAGSTATDATATIARLITAFTANGTDAYRIDHYTVAAQATNGLGIAISDGTNEVYLEIYLTRIG